MKPYTFEVAGSWRGGLAGTGKVKTSIEMLPIAAPAALGGKGGAHDPEELLLSAAATCFLITLAAIVERRALPVSSLSMTSRGVVELENGALTLTSIVHSPRVELRRDAGHGDRIAALEAIRRAEAACLVGRAFKGNVAVSVVEPPELLARGGQAEELGTLQTAPRKIEGDAHEIR